MTIYHRFATQASLRTADRFIEAAESAFTRLAARPGIGAKFDLSPSTANDLRYSPLPTKFKKYVVIYRPFNQGIEIVRVLHGAQDISAILAIEEDEDAPGES